MNRPLTRSEDDIENAGICMDWKTCGECPLFGHRHKCLRYRVEVNPAPTALECEARHNWRIYEEYARHALVERKETLSRLQCFKEKLRENFNKKLKELLKEKLAAKKKRNRRRKPCGTA